MSPEIVYRLEWVRVRMYENNVSSHERLDEYFFFCLSFFVSVHGRATFFFTREFSVQPMWKVYLSRTDLPSTEDSSTPKDLSCK